MTPDDVGVDRAEFRLEANFSAKLLDKLASFAFDKFRDKSFSERTFIQIHGTGPFANIYECLGSGLEASTTFGGNIIRISADYIGVSDKKVLLPEQISQESADLIAEELGSRIETNSLIHDWVVSLVKEAAKRGAEEGYKLGRSA